MAIPGEMDFSEETLKRSFHSLMDKYEVSPRFVKMIEILRNYDISIIADDSGSMNTIVDGCQTRWEELKKIIMIILKIARTLDSDGIDISFLNRGTYENVKDEHQIDMMFVDNPNGRTDILTPLKEIYAKHSIKRAKKPLLILLFTDGRPTNKYGDEVDENGRTMIQNLSDLLKQKDEDVFVNIILCTDDDSVVNEYEKIDKDDDNKNIDLNDDYKSQQKKIKSIQGQNFDFSYGDYITKCMLGSIVPELDKLDEKQNLNSDIPKVDLKLFIVIICLLFLLFLFH